MLFYTIDLHTNTIDVCTVHDAQLDSSIVDLCKDRLVLEKTAKSNINIIQLLIADISKASKEKIDKIILDAAEESYIWFRSEPYTEHLTEKKRKEALDDYYDAVKSAKEHRQALLENILNIVAEDVKETEENE